MSINAASVITTSVQAADSGAVLNMKLQQPHRHNREARLKGTPGTAPAVTHRGPQRRQQWHQVCRRLQHRQHRVLPQKDEVRVVPVAKESQHEPRVLVEDSTAAADASDSHVSCPKGHRLEITAAAPGGFAAAGAEPPFVLPTSSAAVFATTTSVRAASASVEASAQQRRPRLFGEEVGQIRTAQAAPSARKPQPQGRQRWRRYHLCLRHRHHRLPRPKPRHRWHQRRSRPTSPGHVPCSCGTYSPL